MSVVLATIQRGRLDHLDRQVRAVACSDEAPVAHLVVSMDAVPPVTPGVEILHLPIAGAAPLPLAQARNLAVAHAARHYAAELVVLLDVDCLPAPGLLRAYRLAAAARPEALLSGPVHYLPAGMPAHGPLPSAAERAAAPPHPARPAPAAGVLLDEPRSELFWSLSFAVRPEIHAAIGGFDEAYRGYGAEDTDYAARARREGVPLVWVGGATAYHQHHPVSSPPVEHLAEIVVNARRFHDRWDRWPMTGWLHAFAAMGLIDWDPAGTGLRRSGEAISPSERRDPPTGAA